MRANARDNLRVVMARVIERLADKRGSSTPGRPRKEIAAVDAYQAALEREYRDWADDAAEQLADEPEDSRDELLLALLLLLLRRLAKLGEDTIPEAVALGGGTSASVFTKLAELIGSNTDTLTNSLIPAIAAKLRAALVDADIQLALAAGKGAEALAGVLETFIARVGSYAGQWWKAYNQSVGARSVQDGVGLMAHLDPRAHHCTECPEFHAEGGRPYASFTEYLDTTGGRTPGDFECGANCRCWLEYQAP